MQTAAPRGHARPPAVTPRRCPARPWRGTGALLLLTIAALVLLARPARAEDPPTVPLPEGMVGHGGMPPLLPDDPRDKVAVRASCDALVASGRAQRGTRKGGDYLFSAAAALYDTLRQFDAAMPIYEEAVDAYPRGDPTRPIALVHLARREIWRGNHPRAASLVKEVEPWEHARGPTDLTEREQLRWRQLRQALALELPLVRADLHEAAGRLGEAAASLEALAGTQGSGLRESQRARLLAQAARLRHRAGDRAGALASVDRAIELQHDDPGRDDARLAELRYWRLHARHGLLSDTATPYLPRTWPGDAYEQDVRILLREIQDVPGIGTMYLALGSTAYTGGKKELALEIYLLAIRSPDLVEQARGKPMIWRGLLAAFPAALQLGRFEDAERILGIVERVADEPIEEMDDYRAALVEARAAAAEAKQREQAPKADPDPAKAPDDEDQPPAGPPLGLEAEPGAGPTQPEQESTKEADAPPTWPWWAAAAAALALCGFWLIRRR